MQKDTSTRIIRPKHPFDDTFNIHNALSGFFNVAPLGNGCYQQYGIFSNGTCYGVFSNYADASNAESNLRMNIAMKLESYASMLKTAGEYKTD